MTVGRLLQLFGTEVGRELCRDDLWIRPVERQVERATLAIISDVRFPNELAFVQGRNGLVFSVDAAKRLKLAHHKPNPNTDSKILDGKIPDGKSHHSEARPEDGRHAAVGTSPSNPTTSSGDQSLANMVSSDGHRTSTIEGAPLGRHQPLTKDGRSATHASETALHDAQFTAILDNNGSLDEFLTTVRTRAWPTILARLSTPTRNSSPTSNPST
jgi:hypothetical protein